MNKIAYDFVVRHEGCKLVAYADIAGVATCGYGSTGPDVKLGTVWTQAKANERLAADLAKFEAAVRRQVKVPLSEKQEAALISFTYNLGEGALSKATLLALVNARDWIGATENFQRWSHAGGKKVKGLLLRRLREAELFLEGSP